MVLFHVLIWYHDPVFGHETGLHTFWVLVSRLLGLVRMPVLFVLAGVFAARGLLAGWSSGAAPQRAAGSYYVYVLWLAIYFGVSLIVGHRPDVPHLILSFGDFATQLMAPDTTLWFVFALATYALVIAGLVALRLPAWAVMCVGIAGWVIAELGEPSPLGMRVVKNFLFFALGVYYSGHLRRFRDASAKMAAGWCAAFLGLAALAGASSGVHIWPLLASLASIPAAFAVSAQWCKWRPFAWVAGTVGKNTLPIYLLQAPILMALVAFVRPATSDAGLAAPVLDAIMPLGLTAAVVCLSLMIHSLLAKVPGDPFFSRTPLRRRQGKPAPEGSA